MNRRQMMFLTGALASTAMAGASTPSITSRTSLPLFEPMQYGASGNGKTLDSPAINAAIDACTKAGGGVVYLRPGTYHSGRINLKNNVTLYLEAGAVILGSADAHDYSDPEQVHRGRHLIYAQDAENVTIAGPGRIDGQGHAFWSSDATYHVPADKDWTGVASLEWKGKPGRPSPMMKFVGCRWLRIEDVRIENAAGWTLYLVNCDDTHIHDVAITNPVYGRNTDGIDMDGCQNVFISNCSIETGDDAICLKSENPTRKGPRLARNIVVTNCVLSTCCNGFKIGTGTQGGFENITFSNSVIYSEPGEFKNRVLAGVVLEVVDGGWIDGIVVTGIRMQRVRTPIFIRLGDRSKPHPSPQHGLRNVMIENVHASEALLASSVTGVPDALIEHVTLSNVRIENVLPSRTEWLDRRVAEKEADYPESFMFGMLPTSGLYARHVRDLNLSNVSFSAAREEARPTMMLEEVTGTKVTAFASTAVQGGQPVIRLIDTSDVWISNSAAPAGTDTFVGVEGPRSAGVLISNCDLRTAKEATRIGADLDSSRVLTRGNIPS